MDNSSKSDVVLELPWRHSIHAYYDIMKVGDPETIRRRASDGTKLMGFSSECMLLKQQDSWDYFLHHLVSNKRFQLPPVEESKETYWHSTLLIALTVNPTDPNCGVLYINRLDMKFLFYRLHDPQRLIYRQEIPDDLKIGEPMYEQVSCVTSFGGQLYFFTHPCNRLFRVEFASSCIQLVLLTQSTPKNLKRRLYGSFYLVELGGDLLLVHVVHSQAFLPAWYPEDFQLYKLDFETKTWLELTHIGNNVIFLSPKTACSMSTTDFDRPVKRNSIYYYTPIKEDKSIYIFDLENGGTTPHLPLPNGDLKFSVLNWLSSQTFKSCSV